MKAGTGGNWQDLRPRVTSALAMSAVGGAVVLWGGVPMMLLVAMLTGLMIWELARLTAPMAMLDAVGLGLGAAFCLVVESTFGGVTFAFLVLPALALALTPRRDAVVAGIYALGLMISGHVVIALRDGAGIGGLLWLVLIVVASDVAGYFVGRAVGGPKFWPAISPRKTWSGTAAGWGAALVVGAGFWLLGPGGWGLLILSPLIGFSGQMGDVLESWIKRRAGVKDASQLIPGHGGVLDRFDALTGAALMLFLLSPVLGWPVGG